MSSLLQQTSQLFVQSYQSDNIAFKSTKQFPEKKSFLELELIQKILFPDFFTRRDKRTFSNVLERLSLLVYHIQNSIEAYYNQQLAEKCITALLNQFVTIRELVKQDIIAAYAGDPAASSLAMIIRSYPGIHVMMIQRVAHILYINGDIEYSRELMESIHSVTGIDIHPGTSIGNHFFIDHGVGVVIGETAVIGNWCRVYQSVTLGAMSFKEDNGIVIKGNKRHPTIGDFVVIGAGAKVLGNITIGSNVKIGANCWITQNIDQDQIVFISEHPSQITKSSTKQSSKDDKIILQSLTENKISEEQENLSWVNSPELLCTYTSEESTPINLDCFVSCQQ
ncbi:hypothetical protein ENUP19_0047G0023 [Entamoeba nuttalli]|uniref:serine O-acetyltransferase n=2 Tax=Entamoeba nuttalli TaxID=412467 RepID=K2HI17_ENTNP|nr:serine acetyltransferase 1, putative [Entamoeba nuttalli P19]EKE42614.1 serine acetyltransferase 1, putative [Entamoeba nuttalli P19]|eukprot:XP_008855049.1 serine acetyltransferase 1, putative [Entamoeba nuttalli P19]